MLRLLSSTEQVDLLSLVHDDDEASHIVDAERLAASVTAVRVPRWRNTIKSVLSLPTSRPTTHSMLDAPQLTAAVERVVATHRPDVVLAYCSGMARLALEPPLRDFPFVLDMLDVDSAKWGALALTSTRPMSWIYAREARVLARFEAQATRRSVTTLVVTERERQTLADLAPEARIEVVGNGVDAERLRPPDPPSGEPRVVFCGVMNYLPNEEAALWFAKDVWPLVRAQHPDARLQIVGAHPTAAVKALESSTEGIEVTGEVPDVRSYLWAAAVSVAPLLTARGVQNKVLEAMAAGLPVVTTPVVATGLPPQVAPACLVAQDAAPFADAVVKLLRASPAERRRLAGLADLTSLSWSQTLQPLRSILRNAARN